jgi:GMP synthase (glutamine-hydrolysing)
VVAKTTFLDPFLDQVRLIVSHKDQVAALPTGAQLIATSDFCPVAMFSVGEHMFGIQGHPEFSKPYSAEMMGHRRKILGEEKYAEGIGSLEGTLDADVVTSWIVNFIKR